MAELNLKQIMGFGYRHIEDTEEGAYKWFPHSKGGSEHAKSTN